MTTRPEPRIPSGRGRTATGGARPAPGRLAALLAVGAALAATPLEGQEGELPEPMRRLEALAGSWRAERVEFLDAEGRLRRVSSAEAHNELALGGHVLIHRGRLAEPAIETRGWYFWNPETGRLHMGSVATGGRYDEFVGGWEGDRLVMEMVPNPVFGGRRFRMIHDEIREDSYLETLEVSVDGGETWRVSHRQVMRRTDAADRSARAILDALDAYTGHWRTEERTDRRGDPFRFEYEMEWIDPARTIARLHITRVGAEGETSTVFRGFKGREPDGSGVYYHAASPSGRGSRGEVVLEGDDLVTLYDGWTAGGETVRIRDVFRPVQGGSFRSRTLLRDSPAGEWREIGAERWMRVGPPG